MDITIGYSPLGASEVAYDKYGVGDVFFGGKCPRQIHLHVRRHLIDKLPGFIRYPPQTLSPTFNIMDDLIAKEEFSVWLRELFFDKDAALVSFFEAGRFSDRFFLQKSSQYSTSSDAITTFSPATPASTSADISTASSLLLSSGAYPHTTTTASNGMGINADEESKLRQLSKLPPSPANNYRQVVKLRPEVQDWIAVGLSFYSLFFWTGPFFLFILSTLLVI